MVKERSIFDFNSRSKESESGPFEEEKSMVGESIAEISEGEKRFNRRYQHEHVRVRAAFRD